MESYSEDELIEMEQRIYQQLCQGKSREEVFRSGKHIASKVEEKLVYFETPCRRRSDESRAILELFNHEAGMLHEFGVINSRIGICVCQRNSPMIRCDPVIQSIYIFNNGEVSLVRVTVHFAARRRSICLEGNGPAILSEKLKKVLYEAGLSISEIRKYSFFAEGALMSGRNPEPECCHSTEHRWLDPALYTIGVCGELIRGKSTIVNALLGEELSPMDSFPSVTPFCLRYGGKNVVIRWNNGEQEVIDPERVETLVQSYNTDILKEIDMVIVHCPNPMLKGVQLIDLPCLNHTHETERATWDILPFMDAMLMVLAPDCPFSLSEEDFIHRVYRYKCFEHLLFVLNKMDIIREKDRERVVQGISNKIQQKLSEYAGFLYDAASPDRHRWDRMLQSVRLFPVSARLAVEGGQSLVEESGMLPLIQAISDLTKKL